MKTTISLSLKQLLASLKEDAFHFTGDEEQEIEQITHDYKKVTANSLYFCLEDEEFQEPHIKGDSLSHWREAAEAGAVCLATNRNRIEDLPSHVSLIEVDDLNQAFSLISKEFYGDPLKNIKVIGITGTNGKTTTSQLLDSILLRAGQKTGVIGTIGVFYPSGKEEPGSLSNPMASELFRIGKQMRSEEVEFLTMEVTSHAMCFERNHAIDFDVAIFTNLTQDHLDYHKTIESYKKAKLRFFQKLGNLKKSAYGIVNIDDSNGKDFINAVNKHFQYSEKVKIITYGVLNKEADLVAYPKETSGSFSKFDIFFKGNHLSQIYLPMPGLFNIYNGLAAFGAAFTLGISLENIVEGLKNAKSIEGRFEKVECKIDFSIYIDYAHTPDSLCKILQEVRSITQNQVIVVFGCGGDRDRSKRGQMGKIAADMADFCIITSDNPRSEDPNQIIRDIINGIPADTKAEIIVKEDREEAIKLALDLSSTGDSTLIAGKGHETYQIIGGDKLPFSDRKVAQNHILSKQNENSRAWIEIDLKALRRNFELIFQDKPEKLQIMAVLKDDALGHGIIETAKEAMKAGCSRIGVSCLEEALEIRKKNKDIPVLIFGERADDEILLCIKHGFSIQAQSLAKAELISELSEAFGKKTKVHLKVDTGMGRYGVHRHKAVELFKAIRNLSGIEAEGVMTHFAQSDEADKSFANIQWRRFKKILDCLEEEGVSPPLIHACNSGGYLDLPEAHCNMVRIGILSCGVYPSKVCRRININGRELKPAMQVKAKVSFLQTLESGDYLGYGMSFQAMKETKVAILPIGYGDGYPRLRNKGFVLIRGKKAPIIGGNSMDATMVDVTEISETKEGDEAVLLGKQKGEKITAMMIADWAQTVAYDILSGWKRMERVYKK